MDGDSVDSVSEFLPWVRDRPYYSGQVDHHEVIPGQEATTAEADVEASVAISLTQHGIEQLYQHQADAIGDIRTGDDVVVATPTASGKSLTYMIPAFERAITSDEKTLYLAPTKALINDQAATLRSFAGELGFDQRVDIAVYTGDTPDSDRRSIRNRHPDILLMTPEMIHYSLLPFAHSPRHWKGLFRQLSTVVVDEVHQFRGVFGAHASLLFRRLNRITEHYGTDPQYICASATIGNPIEHAATVTGGDSSEYSLVDTDASQKGDRHWLLWNPPLTQEAREDRVQDMVLDPGEEQDPGGGPRANGEESRPATGTDGGTVAGAGGAGAEGDGGGLSAAVTDLLDSLGSDGDDVGNGGGDRRSHNIQSLYLFSDLIAQGFQTLVFTQSRQAAERGAKRSDARLRNSGHRDLADGITAYHGALNQSRRETIEEGLRSGDVAGVWGTDALELGIDIGQLDAVILNGYPGTSMQTFQRAGRAGRGDQDCLVILVASDNPLDQYILAEPERLFDTDAENAAVNPYNETILPNHVECAASEHYLSPDDEAHFEEKMPSVVRELKNQERLEPVDGGSVRWDACRDSPQHEMGLRSIDDREILLINKTNDELLGRLNFGAALRDAHPEAIYYHQKEAFRVERVDFEEDKALLSPISSSKYTQSLREKEVEVLDIEESTDIEIGEYDLPAAFGELEVIDRLTGYLEYSKPGDSSPRECEFQQPIPPHRITTAGIVFEIPAAVERQVRASVESEDDYLAGLHAIEHALISLFPVEILCDRRDIGGLSTVSHSQTSGGTIFVHDAHPGGVGLSREAYSQLGQLLEQTLRLIASCECSDGCPSCIHSPHCGSANEHLRKDVAINILSLLFSSVDS